jgi:hypothetical protein
MSSALARRRSAGPLTLVVALVPLRAWSVDLSDDRLAFSGNATTQTNTSDGGGGSVTWLHNFTPDTLFGIGGEHERLDVSTWNFGTLSGAITRGPGDSRYTLYGDARAGNGIDGHKRFNYFVETLGVTGTYFHQLSVTAEAKQFHVEATSGTLPKVQVAYLWNPHLQTTASYSYSAGGNLGTRLATARVDAYFKSINIFAGGAVGQASPSVLGQGFTAPPELLNEGYIGITKTISQWRSDLSFIVDYQHLSGGQGSTGRVDPVTGNPVVDPATQMQIFDPFTIPASRRWTATLNYVVHIGHHGS